MKWVIVHLWLWSASYDLDDSDGVSGGNIDCDVCDEGERPSVCRLWFPKKCHSTDYRLVILEIQGVAEKPDSF